MPDRRLSGRFALRGLGDNPETFRANAMSRGANDRRRVSARALGLDVYSGVVVDDTSATCEDREIALDRLVWGRAKLTRGRLNAAAHAMQDGVKPGSDDVEAITTVRLQDGKFAVMRGSHRVAALKLGGYKGVVP